MKTYKHMGYTPDNLPKVGDIFKLPNGKIKTITLFDLLATLGGSDLNPKIVDIKTWNKFDRFVHGFLVAARLN